MTTLQIERKPYDWTVATVFHPFLVPARYKGAYGGRGSGKSHFFAELAVMECVQNLGTRVVCIRETQRTLRDSSKQTIVDKIDSLGFAGDFKIFEERIKTPGDGQIIFAGMQDHTAESIKSLEGYKIAWIEEAQTISERSLSLLRPTIRTAGSEIWASWNPTRKNDPIDVFLRQKRPDNSVVIESNWRHMVEARFWTAELEQERLTELALYPERYDHTYEGAYASAFEGAYFAKALMAVQKEGRIRELVVDPILSIKAFWDIGGAGAQSDATAIWVVQFVGERIHILDYIEGIGQPLAYYLDELRRKGFERAVCHTPHDAINSNNITGKRYVDHIRDGGFTAVPPLPNQGRGAASMRIEAVRRILPRCVFDPRTEPGRQALGFYHEKKDPIRNIGLGPEHDWSSHGADAFGLMAVCYEEPSRTAQFGGKLKYQNLGIA